MNDKSVPLSKTLFFDPSYSNCVRKIKAATSPYLFDVYNAAGSLRAYFSYSTTSINLNDIFILTEDTRAAFEVKSDFINILPAAKTYIFNDFETLPYKSTSPHSPAFFTRAGILSKILNPPAKKTSYKDKDVRVFIITERALLKPVPPPNYLKNLSFSLTIGQVVDIIAVEKRLQSLGYIKTSRVTLPTEYSLRGEVFDIYPALETLPFRITFDYDKIERIKNFYPDTQATVDSFSSLLIYPAKEVIWHDALIEKLEEKLPSIYTTPPSSVYNKAYIKEEASNNEPSFTAERKVNAPIDTMDNIIKGEKESKKSTRIKEENSENEALKQQGSSILEALITAKECEGEESFYPILWEKQYSILDYIQEVYKNPPPIYLYNYELLSLNSHNIEKEYLGMYKKTHTTFPCFLPQDMLLSFEPLIDGYPKVVRYCNLKKEDKGKDKDNSSLFLNALPSTSYFSNINLVKEEFTSLLSTNFIIYLFTDNENQALRIKTLLQDFLPDIEEGRLNIIGKPCSAGFILPDSKIKVVAENELFNRRKYLTKGYQTNKSVAVKSSVIDTFTELNAGDYVVHVNYGVGKFLGIERIKSTGHERDFIKIMYANEENVYIPIEQVNLVSRYIGSNDKIPHLDAIGGSAWSKRRAAVKRSVEDIAEHLLTLYSRRKLSHGYAFPPDTEWQYSFEASFPYEDTPDQSTATSEIKKDMEAPRPMDRLLCGDVGYGKTEVAMRAAFKAVMAGRQVAFLCPTTVLTEQHYDTFTQRFKGFPVVIKRLSRLVPVKEQKEVLEGVKSGKVDILIGTHRILQKDVVFRSLSLMVVDEEQRFGVKDKERLKEKKAGVDCLALSATPIPRTLHMSLLKIRDMSLLTTPPQNRQPIETVVNPYSDKIVESAIIREVMRGGQVFYLHNRIESLEETRAKISSLCPNVIVDIAHGAMKGEELDECFYRFKMGAFQVLLATTIIENGIDIPNVNTIIIDRADMYGISQLYQLRGRVGRSDRKAYAYLLYKENKELSEVALKRLQVISDWTELGSGFKIAMKDMEIRGAGNLLGRDQSGNVSSVGFEMYVKLLNQAIKKATNNEEREEDNLTVSLEYTAFIPDTYIKNTQIKMEVYKKIAGVRTAEEFNNLCYELEDRFGPPPSEVQSLLSISQIKIAASRLNITKIEERAGRTVVEFGRVKDISIDKVLSLIKVSGSLVTLDSKKPNAIVLKTGSVGLKEKAAFIKEKLAHLL